MHLSPMQCAAQQEQQVVPTQRNDSHAMAAPQGPPFNSQRSSTHAKPTKGTTMQRSDIVTAVPCDLFIANKHLRAVHGRHITSPQHHCILHTIPVSHTAAKQKSSPRATTAVCARAHSSRRAPTRRHSISSKHSRTCRLKTPPLIPHTSEP